MLGDRFTIKCGVCQGRVLSPFLFALYVDDLIIQLRHCGYGIRIVSCLQGVFSMQMYCLFIVILLCSAEVD